VNRSMGWLWVVVAMIAGTGGYFAGRKVTQRAAIGAMPESPQSAIAAEPRASFAAGRANRTGPNAQGLPGDWEARWAAFVRAVPRSPADERAQAAALAELAATDPQRALALVRAEPNLAVRAGWRDAVLRGWATHDAAAAARYALSLRESERGAAIAAVLTGAVAQSPETAAQLGGRLSAEDAPRAPEYGQALVSALADAGEFRVAARFVAGTAATPLRAEQMNTAFQLWAEHRPAEAAAAVDELADPDLRREAFRGLAVGWAAADPAALANFAAALPPGESRAQALANAVPRWVEQDPVAAAQWLVQHDGSPDYDMGVLAVANQPALLAGRPETAMSLAASISDPPLRTNTLRTLALKWAEHDPAAARRFVAGSPDFSPEERNAILAETGPTP